jgi:NADH-quinone oxidoreductase subunit H
MTGISAMIFLAVKILVLMVSLLLVVAYLTFLERRVLGLIQIRIGPNRTGPWGLLQPLADGLKLIGKEMLAPDRADRFLFRAAPVMAMVPAFLVYSMIPLGENLKITEVNVGLIMILAVSSLGIYGIIIGGWSSNSKYSALGALRSAAQMISYEVSLLLAVVSVVLVASTLNLSEIVAAQKGAPFILYQPVAFFIFLVAGVAETNRCPFDLPEAESELVGGYHTEYSSMKFSLFFMAEYVNMITSAALAVTLFLGGYQVGLPASMLPEAGWALWILQILAFVIKVGFFLFLFVWVRWTLPRFRYDQLMNLGWKRLFPLALANVMAIALLLAFDVIKR